MIKNIPAIIADDSYIEVKEYLSEDDGDAIDWIVYERRVLK